MKIYKRLLFFALFALAAPVSAAFTPHFNFQGRLTDANGDPVTDAKTVLFSIWNSTGGGDYAVYTETHTVTPDANGVYTALIGSINKTLESIYYLQDLWLEVTVNGETISPRFRLASSPNAITVNWSAISNIPPQYLFGSGLQRDIVINLNGASVLAHAYSINFSTLLTVGWTPSWPAINSVDVDFASSACTMQGNTFNISNKLLMLNGAGALPSLNANSLTLLGSTLTVRGNAMSVGGNSFVVKQSMVGIGTPNPSSKLHISSGGFILDGTDPYVNIGDQTFVITNRRVGIGTASPDSVLSVNGDASKVGGGTWQTFSDARLKDVTGPFSYDLKEIRQLNPVRYHYKTDNPLKLPSDKENIGFIAQDVQKVMPEAVRTTSNGYLTLGSDPILWSMLNAIKEMSARNEALKARIAQLENLRSR